MSSPRIERKLAAIMFTDIAGYTKSMSKSESKTLNLLEKKRSILKPLLKEYKGTFVKEIGDGTLSYFESAVNAATCAVKLQETTYDDKEMNIRVGIHIGDIVFKDGDVFGGGVNVASRLESIAPAGGVCVSKSVYDELSNQDDFDGIELGLQSLKGVGRLIEVFGLKGDKLNEPDPQKYQENKVAVHSDDEVPSIAIVPLKNKGDDKDIFYAYGISTDIIKDCIGAGLIRVESLDRIEKIENYDKLDITELAAKLSVRYIATGTLWKMDDIFQLSIELYDTKNSKVIWSDRWQENWENLSTITCRLSESLLYSLNLEIKYADRYVKPESYEYFLQAQYKNIKAKSNEEFLIVKDLLERAIKIDNDNVHAKIYLGIWYLMQNKTNIAQEIILKTLKQSKILNHQLGIGGSLHVLGGICIQRNNYDEAIERYKESLKIFKESNNIDESACSLTMLGRCYTHKFQLDKALKNLTMAYEIKKDIDDKYHNSVMLASMGDICVEKGELDEGLGYYKEALDLENEIDNFRGATDTLMRIAYCYYYKGKYEKALKNYERSYAMQQDIKDFYKIWWTPIWLQLARKKAGKQYVVDTICELIKDRDINRDKNGYRLHFMLYELLEEISHLQCSYELIFEKANKLEPNVKTKFLNSHIPAAIVEEWEKVK